MESFDVLVVNLIGGPCSGKSTISAEVYAELKKQKVNVELLSEVIKDKIYENNINGQRDQIKLFADTLYKMKNLSHHVDVIINDGSIINNIYYNKEENKAFNKLILSEYNRFDNLDIFINRNPNYFTGLGRIHNLKQSLDADEGIKAIYKENNLSYIEVSQENAKETIIKLIGERLK